MVLEAQPFSQLAIACELLAQLFGLGKLMYIGMVLEGYSFVHFGKSLSVAHIRVGVVVFEGSSTVPQDSSH